MAVQFSALTTQTVRELQAGGCDANGHQPERHISKNGGTPCRHCLSDVAEGDAYLILAHRPFPEPQPYAEQGPIFLHATECEPYRDDGAIPSMLGSPQYIVRGYGSNDRIVYGSGRIVTTDEIPQAADAMFTNNTISYIHVRSASNNCYQCRIDRA